MESTTSREPTGVHPALATVAGDRCTNCGAPLAADQRYCVQCGQRRGQAGLPEAAAAAPRPAAAPEALRPRGPRASVNTTLVAGIGTLLLAMGVGVLIGRSGQKDSGASARAPVQVVTVAGGGPIAATAGDGSAASAKKARSSRRHSAPTAAKAATTNVKGTTIKLPPKAVVKVGQTGHGPGYQHGKFTGNFFGGG